MQKVKVQRYVSGKIPLYARNISDESSGDEDFIDNRKSITINKVRERGRDPEEDEDR